MDYAKRFRNRSVLILICAFIRISCNIIDTTNVKLRGREKGIFLSDYYSNDKHLLLSTER